MTTEEMKEFRWGTPDLLCRVALTEWAEGGYPRHCNFVSMRGDKKEVAVVGEN